VLYTQLGNVDGARADHGRLLTLDPALAAKLEAVIAGRARDDGTEGLTAQYE
jgi:hypothetical protein